MRLVVILHNIRSLHNVGSIFRTSDGAGVEKLYLCGITPVPVDRFGNIRKEVAKVALGAERAVPWEHAVRTAPLLARLARAGWHLLAVEQSRTAEDIGKALPRLRREKKIAVLLGEEVRGVPPALLRRVERVVEIPMYGKKESLNVSVAAGIALFALRSSR
ncbi:MAG: TrmH family RNA methyltransferase [Candidatus Liptonbacteria bacterium]|nr:TrmH family RNA methyltransferase [Candidatus Liptonbacteria bacterium]